MREPWFIAYARPGRSGRVGQQVNKGGESAQSINEAIAAALSAVRESKEAIS